MRVILKRRRAILAWPIPGHVGAIHDAATFKSIPAYTGKNPSRGSLYKPIEVDPRLCGGTPAWFMEPRYLLGLGIYLKCNLV
jgi:hypothetical protein